MGAGKKVMRAVMEYSRDIAKRKGNVTLFSESNTKTIKWYEENGFISKQGESNGRILINNTKKRQEVFGFSEKTTSGGKMKYPVVENLSPLEGETGDEYIDRVMKRNWQKNDENDEEYAARMAAQEIADTAHWERTKNEPDLDEEFGICGGLGGPGVEERNPGVREQIMKNREG
jgi:hypothetical protein